jgi:hypothetical protein
MRKTSPVLGFDPRTVQPVASHYTDYAIPAHDTIIIIIIIIINSKPFIKYLSNKPGKQPYWAGTHT